MTNFGNVNEQQIDQMRKNVIKSLKDVGFCVAIETNTNIVHFLDISFI